VSIRFLLDTNILSEPLKLEPNQAVLDQMDRYQSEVAIASVTWHEAWYGCYRLSASRRRDRIAQYLVEVIEPGVPILPYGDDAALWFAKERARLVALGKTPSFLDGQIAAIAVVNDLILVTNNLADYVDLSELKTDNWFWS
jgi:tRNA(fMet)-specific endonuclease VapC